MRFSKTVKRVARSASCVPLRMLDQARGILLRGIEAIVDEHRPDVVTVFCRHTQGDARIAGAQMKHPLSFTQYGSAGPDAFCVAQLRTRGLNLT